MKKIVGLLIFLLSFSLPAFAARPLSCDDAGTVEKGRLEMELGFEYADDTNDEYNWSSVLKYGLGERWDIGVEIPYQYIDRASEDDVDGISDIVVCSKHRFLDEGNGLSAIALGFSLKTNNGDEDKELGTGELDYAINTILTKALGKIITHLNLGYTYVGAPEGESHDDIFSYAIALEYPFNNRLNLVGELTGETNFEGDFDDNPLRVWLVLIMPFPIQ